MLEENKYPFYSSNTYAEYKTNKLVIHHKIYEETIEFDTFEDYATFRNNGEIPLYLKDKLEVFNKFYPLKDKYIKEDTTKKEKDTVKMRRLNLKEEKYYKKQTKWRNKKQCKVNKKESLSQLIDSKKETL